MGIGRRLKEAREKNNLTQAQLAKLLGITPSSITNYENETSHPKEEILLKIFDVLNVEPNFLFQDSYKKSDFNCTFDEQTHIEKYRTLDEYGKEAVDSTLELEYKRVHNSNEEYHFIDFDSAFNYLTSIPTFAMGGYDIDNMNKEELIDFANDMYEMDQRALKLFK